MTNRQTVIDHILTDTFYEEVLKKYLSNKSGRDEFRQELWLIILEMPDDKLIHYYDTKCLKYIYIGIINNQIKSNTSAWHRNYRKNQPQEYFDNIYDSIDEADYVLNVKTENEDKLDYITDKLVQIESADPKMVRDITLFKMHFYEGMTYRAIEKATNIGYVNVFHYVNNIKNILIKNKSQVKITDPTIC